MLRHFCIVFTKLPQTITLLSLCLILPPHFYLVSLSYCLCPCHIPFFSDHLNLCVSAALIFNPLTHPCLQLLLSSLTGFLYFHFLLFLLSILHIYFFSPPLLLFCATCMWTGCFPLFDPDLLVLVWNKLIFSFPAQRQLLLKPSWPYCRAEIQRDAQTEGWSSQMSINFKWMLQTFSSPGHPNTQRCTIAFLSVFAHKPLAALSPAPTRKYPLVYSSVLTQAFLLMCPLSLPSFVTFLPFFASSVHL